MTTVAAVSVHDDLATGKTAIAHGPPDDKTPRRIDMIFHIGGQQLGRNDFLDHAFDHRLA